jgi:acetoin utilization deacetylase AcuC-like enzyme
MGYSFISYSNQYVIELPQNHIFPIEKYELLKEQLLYRNVVRKESFFEPPVCPDEIVHLTHSKEYTYRLKNNLLSTTEIRRIGFPFSETLVKRCYTSTMGTVLCAKIAMDIGISFNIAGGTHHSFFDKGEGFCLLNDIAVAANWLLHQKKVKKILVVDLDVHQGNGTAKIFYNNDNVFTFSMHSQDNYPLKKEKSNLDIGLKAHTNDDTYLNLLRTVLPKLLDTQKPNIIFYQSGVDVLETDLLGKLSLTIKGCKERDCIVFEQAQKRNIPIVVTMGGGYSKKLSDTVDAHFNCISTGIEIYNLN